MFSIWWCWRFFLPAWVELPHPLFWIKQIWILFFKWPRVHTEMKILVRQEICPPAPHLLQTEDTSVHQTQPMQGVIVCRSKTQTFVEIHFQPQICLYAGRQKHISAVRKFGLDAGTQPRRDGAHLAAGYLRFIQFDLKKKKKNYFKLPSDCKQQRLRWPSPCR